MKCHSNIPKYEEFKFLNECQIQFDSILESLKSARKLYLDSGKLSENTFRTLLEIDISPTKKYIETICKWAIDNIKTKDYPGELFLTTCRIALPIYDTLCNKKLIKQTDINSFKTLNDFEEFVDEHKNLTSKAEQKNLIKTKEADVILDDDRWFIISPLTHGASCIFGAGTKWCTTMKDPDYWESYISQFVKFYYCLDKSKDKTDPRYKFAVAVYPSGDKECYNAEDNIFDFKDVLKLGLKENIFKAEIPTLEKRIKIWFEDDYTIDEDGFYSTDGNVNITDWKEKQLPIKFKYVGGKFDCSMLQLETLEGCPEEVGFAFNCSDNKLTSLKGGPKKVGEKYFCADNKLKTLEHFPKNFTGTINCSFNKLTSLKGGPSTHMQDFYCQNNDLTSLKYGPTDTHNYIVSYNNISSLEGFPKIVKGSFKLDNNRLTSLDGFSTKVTNFLDVEKNKLPKNTTKPESVNIFLNL